MILKTHTKIYLDCDLYLLSVVNSSHFTSFGSRMALWVSLDQAGSTLQVATERCLSCVIFSIKISLTYRYEKSNSLGYYSFLGKTNQFFIDFFIGGLSTALLKSLIIQSNLPLLPPLLGLRDQFSRIPKNFNSDH